MERDHAGRQPERRAHNHRYFTGGPLAIRKVVNVRQMAAARLLVDGVSAFRALTGAGYSRYTARNFSALLRSSWGLREAIRLEQASRQSYIRLGPVRRRRYDRRPVANAVLTYCGAEDRNSTSNVWLHKLHAGSKHAQAVGDGRLGLPIRCSRCRGPLEGQDRWCPRCQRVGL